MVYHLGLPLVNPWFTPAQPPVYPWSTSGLLTYRRFAAETLSLSVVNPWFTPGQPLVYSWSSPGLPLVNFWFTSGLPPRFTAGKPLV